MTLTDRVKSVTAAQWAAAGIITAALAGSSWAWYGLALRTGFPHGLAAVPTIALDLGALYYGRNWITGRTAALRRWGLVTTVAAVVISIGGNSVEHAIAAGFLAVTLPLALAVGAIPPVTAFAAAHQWALDRAAPPRRPARRMVPAAPESAGELHAILSKRDRARAAWFRLAEQAVAEGRDPSGIRPSEVDRAAGTSKYANKFIAGWLAEWRARTGEAAG